ncbi:MULTISPECIES: hypothetical protein [Frankia]|uniref:hypothetical protein n=1 Tax=Frankia TaxID=1854 RepID=UPI000B14EF74|nr:MULTISPECIES: hypothetical protein [Frankia]
MRLGAGVGVRLGIGPGAAGRRLGVGGAERATGPVAAMVRSVGAGLVTGTGGAAAAGPEPGTAVGAATSIGPVTAMESVTATESVPGMESPTEIESVTTIGPVAGVGTAVTARSPCSGGAASGAPGSLPTETGRVAARGGAEALGGRLRGGVAPTGASGRGGDPVVCGGIAVGPGPAASASVGAAAEP